MKWGSTAASGSGLHAFQPSMSLEAGSRGVHAHFSSSMHLLVPGAYRPQQAGPRGRQTAVSMHLLVPGAYRPWSSYLHTDARSVSMHLLVPGAYRLEGEDLGFVYQTVSMHLLVPGAYRPKKFNLPSTTFSSLNAPSGAGCLPTRDRYGEGYFQKGSQCTFWCRVLTDIVSVNTPAANAHRLNAPSGAGCLPTSSVQSASHPATSVSMHLLVPGAYRHVSPGRRRPWHRVSMHLLVPGAYRPVDAIADADLPSAVSMHLLVPGAYRLAAGVPAGGRSPGLNAPSGAGCLPTVLGRAAPPVGVEGSQCTFWCRVLTDSLDPLHYLGESVSMHLLVPGAYRHLGPNTGRWRLSRLNAPSGAGCLPT